MEENIMMNEIEVNDVDVVELNAEEGLSAGAKVVGALAVAGTVAVAVGIAKGTKRVVGWVKDRLAKRKADKIREAEFEVIETQENDSEEESED